VAANTKKNKNSGIPKGCREKRILEQRLITGQGIAGAENCTKYW
jgi:hypothetical protein